MGSLIPFSPLAARARRRLTEFHGGSRTRGAAWPDQTSPERRDPVVVLMDVSDRTQFLDAQIRSILDQTWGCARLVIRDHGASDKNRETLDAWRRRPDVLVFRAGGPRTRAGVLDLLGLVEDSEIVAFADEDALWNPNKLARAVAMLGDASNRTPALYCSRAFRVGDAASVMTPRWPGRPSFGNALVENIALGATVVLNPRAAALLRQAGTPAGAISAGWWSYLVTSAFGQVAFDDWASILLSGSEAASLDHRKLPDIVAQARSFLIHYGDLPSLRDGRRRLASSLARGSQIERRLLAFNSRLRRRLALDDARLRLAMLAGPWPSIEEPRAGPRPIAARAA